MVSLLLCFLAIAGLLVSGVFFFSSRRRHTRFDCDWSSDVCSSDLGAWVFAGGLHPSSTATVLRVENGEVLTTDGPFAEGKEHIGGFWVIKTPDLDAALEWGRKATRACTVPVEVRPFQE